MDLINFWRRAIDMGLEWYIIEGAIILFILDLFIIYYYFKVYNDINKGSTFNVERFDTKRWGVIILIFIHFIYFFYTLFPRFLLGIMLPEWKGYALSDMYPAARGLAFTPLRVLFWISCVGLCFVLVILKNIRSELPTSSN